MCQNEPDFKNKVEDVIGVDEVIEVNEVDVVIEVRGN